MVGVPGKSKGCSTCRRRKKGCDQRRPVCGQCSASGYVCGGYQRDLTFVLHPASKAVEKAIFLPSRPHPSQLPTTPSLERSAIVVQCQSLFYDVYLPHGKCVVTDQFILKCGRPANWTHVMRSFTPSERSLQLAFAAFSMSRVGRNKDDPRLIEESTKFYGKALKNLQKALYDPSRMHSEQVLTACLLLGLYETFEGAGGKSVGWVSHAQGAARIVELRGPERHAELPAHVLFLGTRLPITYSAILRRKKTFLSDEDWLTVPWRREHKTGLDRLIDIATHIPGLLEQFDAIRAQASSAGQLQALQSCLTLCRRLQKSLSIWTTIRRPNSGPITIPHETTGPYDTYPFTHELVYENHLFLNANLIHWSSALVISNTVSEIEFLLASFGFQSANMLSSTATAIQESQECANNIAKSILYCLWPEMGDLGIDYIQFPMCLAFQYFMKSSKSDVCAWMLERAREMQSTGGPTDSPTANSPTSYADVDVSLAMFGAPGFGMHLAPTPTYPCGSPSPETMQAQTASIDVLTQKTGDLFYRATNIREGRQNQSSDFASSIQAMTSPTFDVGYDLRDDDVQSTASTDSELPTITSSRHNSASGPSGSSIAMFHDPFRDNNDFTFVQENPSKYYIDQSEVAVSTK